MWQRERVIKIAPLNFLSESEGPKSRVFCSSLGKWVLWFLFYFSLEFSLDWIGDLVWFRDSFLSESFCGLGFLGSFFTAEILKFWSWVGRIWLVMWEFLSGITKSLFFFSWREGDFNRARVDCECGKKRERIGDFGGGVKWRIWWKFVKLSFVGSVLFIVWHRPTVRLHMLLMCAMVSLWLCLVVWLNMP